ncbi:kelch 12 [Octopus vulgaris]|uniref:Kelch 12 n=1 Tax=Octopus vulgaris TaxID=6645 RepID=A0AA36B520_OCTVU|nr:kelch 12 [Octopus vulgaris]
MNDVAKDRFDNQNGCCQLEEDSNHTFEVSSDDICKFGICDIGLIVEQELIECHKQVLSENSQYFKAMFESTMKEKSQKTIDLKCVSLNSFKVILDFCYSKPAPLLIDRDNIFDVTRIADMLNFSEVFSLCKNFLWSLVSQNCFDVLMLASTLFIKDLHNYCTAYVLWNFKTIKDNEDFVFLTKDELQNYLSDSRLNTVSELPVYKSIITWINHDPGQRTKYFKELFSSCVHVGLMSSEELEVLQESDLVKSTPNILQTVESAYVDQDSSAANNDSTGGSKRPSHLRQIPQALLWVGGDKSKLCDKPSPHWNVMRWDATAKEYVKLDDMYPVTSPVEADMGYRVCSLGVEVYVLGGEAKLGSNKWQIQTWAYDLLKRKWIRKACLLQPRRHHAVCVLDNDIYVIGGFTKYREITVSVHCYHSNNDSWTVCSDLIRPEFAATAAALNNRVYLLKTLIIQCYNPSSNQWTIVTTDVPPAITPGFTVMSAITVGNSLIIQSGYNNKLYLYDPYAEDQDQAWTSLGCFKDVFGSCAELDGKIYCMGNDSNHMETYDIESQTFGIEMSVSCHLSRSFLVTVPFYEETMT